MRVTHRMIVDNAIRYMQDNLEQLNALNEKAATGKEFQAASENPAAASAVLSLRSSLQTNAAYLAIAQVTDDWMAATENALKGMVDLGTRAQNIALSGLSDSHDLQALQLMATEIDSILKQAIEIGNTQHRGDYIFAGFKTSTQPFDFVPGSPDTVSWSGNGGQMQRSLSPGESVTANVLGNVAFSDFFTALIEVRDRLQAGDLTNLQSAIASLQSANQTVAQERSASGARQQQVKAAILRGQETEFTLKRLISGKEDANMVEAITELRHQETTYQAVLEVGRRTLATLNLFDILR